MGSRRTGGDSNHLSFIKVNSPPGRKLPTYDVYNDKFDQYIGVIHWRGGWRQYVWTANENVDMSRCCMKEIIPFIDKIMKEWKESKNV